MRAPDRPRWLSVSVLVLCASHALLTALLARARYATVHHHTFDLALYARLAWGLVHGEAWDPIVSGGGLGGHLAFVLLPLGALGALIGTVPALVIVQSLAVAGAAWPLSRIAERRGGPLLGLCAALAWLLQPNLGHVASYEFHPGNVAVLPMLWLIDLCDRPRASVSGRTLAWAVVLTLACRASLAMQTLMLGVLLLPQAGDAAADRRVALHRGLVLGAASFAYLVLWLVLEGTQHSLGAAGSSADLHFAKWGGSPFGALRVLFTDPSQLFEHFTTPERVSYPVRVLAPLLLLPLLAPRTLLPALPVLALNVLSEFPTAPRLDSHYLTPALPPLAWGAVLGACWLRERLVVRLPRASNVPALALAGAALAGSVLAGGLPWSYDFAAADFRAGPESMARLRVLAAIGPEVFVQAPDPLLPHLAERRGVFRGPPPERKADVVVLDLAHRVQFAQREDLLRTVQEPFVRSFLARPDWQAVVAERGLLVLYRGRPARAGLARAYLTGVVPVGSGRPLTRCLALLGADLRARSVTLELAANEPCPPDLALRLGIDGKPPRVDLPFDGVLSPANLRPGDRLRSTHALSRKERDAIERHGLRVGVLRSSGARPRPEDPIALQVPLRAR